MGNVIEKKKVTQDGNSWKNLQEDISKFEDLNGGKTRERLETKSTCISWKRGTQDRGDWRRFGEGMSPNCATKTYQEREENLCEDYRRIEDIVKYSDLTLRMITGN